MIGGFETKEEAINDAVLDMVANGGAQIIIHRDQPSGEPYRDHDLEHDRWCWCCPEVKTLG